MGGRFHLIQGSKGCHIYIYIKGCLDVSHHLLQTLWGMLAPISPISTIDQAAGHSPQQFGCVILHHKPCVEDSSDDDIPCSFSGKAETLRTNKIDPELKQDLFSFSPVSQGLLRRLGVTGVPFGLLSPPPLSSSSCPKPQSIQPSQVQYM